jgi:hypothetical protein
MLCKSCYCVKQGITGEVFIMMTRFEVGLSRVENALSYISRIPFVGIVPGVAKVAIGAIQAVSAIGIGLTAGLTAAAFGDTSIAKRSWVHIRNGAGNVAAGFCEAIPFLGTHMWDKRLQKVQRERRFSVGEATKTHPLQHKVSITGRAVFDNQQIKYMTYPSMGRSSSDM